MSNAEKIENILAILEGIDNARGAVAASLARKRAFALAFTLLRAQQESDRDRIAALEARADELGAQLSWLCAYCNPEFAPKGAEIVESIGGLLTEQVEQPPAPDDIEGRVKRLAEELEVDETMARAMVNANVERGVDEARTLVNTLKATKDGIARSIDAWVSSEVRDVGLNEFDTFRLLDQMANKIEQLALRTGARMERTLRPRLRTRLNADFRLLMQALEKAEDLALQAEHEAEAQPSTDEPTRAMA